MSDETAQTHDINVGGILIGTKDVVLAKIHALRDHVLGFSIGISVLPVHRNFDIYRNIEPEARYFNLRDHRYSE